ncbi:ESF1 homolog [Pectinophora gossypiella]|nr:ESF1 homolog [Pectinophora gossypiella]
MGDILKDSRFTKYLNDPKYRQIPKHERKVKIDKRFQSMFSDEKFKVKYTVDKRGRPVNETSTENLRKYYDIDESESSSTDDEEGEEEKTKTSSQPEQEAEPGRFVRRPEDDNTQDEVEKPTKFKNDKLVRGKLDYKTKERLLDLDIDYARGEGILMTDSSSEESSEEEEESELEHEWGELDADAETTEESTRRIAICHLDWDNIKATDIMVLLNSFLPPGGVIQSVTIYPSEYGLKRMQEEEVRGPIELTEKKVEDSDNEGNEEGSAYHMEKLRRYQLNRLKYYYAVVECDSVTTADKLYSECDGMEYESSATKIDMRFIPDDVTFDQEPRETCNKLPDLRKYKPRLFTTTALQQAKVELTWDATNPNRTEVIKSALDGKIDDLDLKDYLASSSEDEDDYADKADSASQSDNDNDDPISKYKALLEDIEKKDEKTQNKDMELEITWGIGVKDKAEELVKKKINNDDKNLTPFEKLLKKKKEKKKQKKLKNKQKENDNEESGSDEGSEDEIPSDIDMNDPYFAEEFNKTEFKKSSNKKKQDNKNTSDVDSEDEKRKAELELLLDEDDGKAHFSLKKIQEGESESKKSKRKRKLKAKMMEQRQALPDFEINVNDERFSALYDSHHYNIDPSDPNFKKTKNMEKLIKEKLKRRPSDTPVQNQVQSKKSKEEAELSLLVKNIKRKIKDVIKK